MASLRDIVRNYPEHQGSTKLLSCLSEITETPIFHGNFAIEITYKIPQKVKKGGIFTEQVFVTETGYCNI